MGENIIEFNDQVCEIENFDKQIDYDIDEKDEESFWERYFKIRYFVASGLIITAAITQHYADKESDIFRIANMTMQCSALSLGIMFFFHNTIEEAIAIYKGDGIKGVYNFTTSCFYEMYYTTKQKLQDYYNSCNEIACKIYENYIKGIF